MMWRVAPAAIALVIAAPATRATYVSPDGQSRLAVVPRDLESNLAYSGILIEDPTKSRHAAARGRGATCSRICPLHIQSDQVTSESSTSWRGTPATLRGNRQARIRC